MKIVVLDGYTENPGDLSWDELAVLGELVVHERTPLDKIVARIGDAEIVIVNKTPLSRETITACANLKYIGVLATGYNVVDIVAAQERGIPVCNVPTYGTESVGQFAIALLLEICHRIGHHANAVQTGRWSNSPDWCFWDYPQLELLDKTIGIIGFGRIGQVTGRVAKALGMKILAFDEYPNDSGRELAKYVTLEELLSQSDVIALHCPLFPSTLGIINKENIAKMKDGVIIINNSRGQLVVEQDLAVALNTGKVYAAGLDVVSVEPVNADSPLLTAKNCIITPHISWAPKEARQRIMQTVVAGVKAFMDAKPINVVNGL